MELINMTIWKSEITLEWMWENLIKAVMCIVKRDSLLVLDIKDDSSEIIPVNPKMPKLE